MKPIFASIFLMCAMSASAVTTTVSFTPNLAIPDNSTVGVADFHTVTSSIQWIESVEVTLQITGGFNGDYYVYLQHGSGFSVLLNRPGKNLLNDLGYADSGVFVTFAQTAANGDPHFYQAVTNPAGGPITGTWQPDGRIVDPLNVLDTDARSATLNSFAGNDANGEWTLFVADRSSGGTGTLTSWSLNITGAIPEPSTVLGLLVGTSMLFLRRRSPAA